MSYNSNCNLNGRTVLLSKDLVITGTPAATQQQYSVSLLQYLTCNRKICVTSAFPLSGALNAQVVGTPLAIGNDTYKVNIVITGTVTYQPYKRNCNSCCQPSTRTEDVYIVLTADIYSTTTPTVTLGANAVTPVVSPANVQDCCNLTNVLELDFTLVVNSAAA